MKSTQILLRDNVAHLGKVGDVVQVSPGYARNFLYPRGLAIHATPENIAVMARKRVRQDAVDAERMAVCQIVADKIEGVSVTIEAKCDSTGSLYGSVGAAQIAAAMVAAEHAVEERQVRLDHPIKEIGEHEVQVHIHAELNATIKVVVQPEGGVLPAPRPEAVIEDDDDDYEDR
jgi:large subunit ribosomal protein L9